MNIKVLLGGFVVAFIWWAFVFVVFSLVAA